ncbi:N-acetylmuramoyl-L-alanine amidase [Streptomyces phytophilus]|uniref:N-acetylmuramoyl-L-alanine amidase n=1 Tax=Streptomyces phytophilus TaxID=722715 RepID=UPI0015F016B5|nr:N-acetylmuramoyl-L-alanine amidase [Streptomyces phytophilus]
MSSQNRRPLRAYLLLAPVAPLAFAGVLVWQSVDGDGSAANGREPGGAPSASSSPTRPTAGDPEDSNDAQNATDAKDPEVGEMPLAGKVIVLDPGHNPNNRDHAAEINRQVDIGTVRKECDTTGTATNGGYAEADFTLDVARRARTLLRAQGAEVRLTQDGKREFGPCVDERAEAGNKAGADAVVSIHADGGGPGARGFHVILPGSVDEGKADTTAIVKPSRKLGKELKSHFAEETGSKPSNYVGNDTGFTVRTDLGGLNLSTVPKVFIECGNMRDAKDAGRLTDAAWRQRAAHGITNGIGAFLAG